jgi:hypothetical protein
MRDMNKGERLAVGSRWWKEQSGVILFLGGLAKGPHDIVLLENSQATVVVPFQSLPLHALYLLHAIAIYNPIWPPFPLPVRSHPVSLPAVAHDAHPGFPTGPP